MIFAGDRLAGSKVYLTMTPCVRCANTLIQARVAEVIYDQHYQNGTQGSVERLQAAGVKVRRFYSPGRE